MARVLGRATIKVNGVTLQSKPGATLNPGGIQRDPVIGSRTIHGATEQLTAPQLTVRITQSRDATLKQIQAIEEATILFEGDDGVSYVLDKAFSSAVPTLNETAGEISATFSAISCEEIR